MKFSSGRVAQFLPAALSFVALAFDFTCTVCAAQQPAVDRPGATTTIADASPPPPGPPPPAILQNLLPPSELSFLNDYTGKTPKAILKDKRFRALLKESFPNTEYHYGRDKSLLDASEELLDTDPIPITVREGRYATIGTRGGTYLAGKTMMWFDMQSGMAMGAIYFHPSNGEPAPTLTIFSKQLTDTDLSMSQIPQEFVSDLYAWLMQTRIPIVSPRYFIPANGRKYVLVHDEDYCFHSENEPMPDGCEQANADAADDDMNAAYFMNPTY